MISTLGLGLLTTGGYYVSNRGYKLMVTRTYVPGVFLEYLLGNAVLAEVQDGRGTWEDLGDLAPGPPLPLEPPGAVGVDVKDAGEAEAEAVQATTHQRPQGELAGGG